MKVVKITTDRVHKTMYQDEPTLWPADKAAKRQTILSEVGAEYAQINLLITMLNVIVDKIPEIKNDPIITDTMIKLNRIEEIRTSVITDPIAVLSPVVPTSITTTV
jgi:hypothetical protein